MLGKTAGGLLWMARYLERSEQAARLVEAGQRIALTRSMATEDEWASIISTAAAREPFLGLHQSYTAASVVDFLLRERANPSSVCSALVAARNNARLVRTALTREVWEAINVCWLTVTDALRKPIELTALPGLLELIKQQCALVRGAMHGTMLRNEIYNFVRVGTFLERSDNTARILDVKYYVLLPEVSAVGSSLDNVQWETILRAASAERSFRWLHGADTSPIDIASFLILDRRMPRSLAFCYGKLVDNLSWLDSERIEPSSACLFAKSVLNRLSAASIQEIFDSGLHEFIVAFIRDNSDLGRLIEKDFRFHE
jgi:uncharacterized alpha-E superfamily protein